MKITLIFVGKTVKTFLKDGEAEYDKRLKRYIKLEEIIIPELKNASKLSELEIKKKEGELILNKINTGDEVVLLDDKGTQFSSINLANWIDKFQIGGCKNLVFIVGGAYGFSQPVYERAQHKLSLSKLTFSHQMVRMIFKEQLYRSFSILKGEPYHHQ
jgi:23S rRNA (pseudouridine1915-N3)-methyltransferase